MTLDLARGMRKALNPNVGVHGPWQWGVVQAVNANGTVNVTLDGDPTTVVSNLSYLASYVPTVGNAVFIARQQGPARTARVVMGVLGSSPAPKGLIKHVNATGGVGTISAPSQIPNIGITATLVAGRYYRVRGSCLIQVVSQPGIMQAAIYNGPTQMKLTYRSVEALEYYTMPVVWEGACVVGASTPTQVAPGSSTWYLEVLTNGGTLNVQYSAGFPYNADMSLEDIGSV